MDEIVRLNLLSEQMRLEADGDVRMDGSTATTFTGLHHRCTAVHVTQACMPNGKKIKLLKTLLSSVCERDCHYCAFRTGRDFRRISFRPEEFASLVSELFRRGIIEGAFISSGITGGCASTQDRLIKAAELLRKKHHYKGYLHLKIMPGAEKDQVERTMELANRVSVNLEAPNTNSLVRLAPNKFFDEELMTRLKWINEIRASRPSYLGWNGHWPSSTTQFVAGGADESDAELLHTSMYLYRNINLKRVYYMAFNPVENTPLENHPPTSALRQRRLYQASFLLRDYGFDIEEMPFSPAGSLPLETDPKTAWAEKELAERPVEINQADREMLLRVPGIGLKGAETILKMRQYGAIRELAQLRKLGIRAERATRFILLDGHRSPTQLSLL